MKSDLVTIIVPVRNAEDYIERCVKSLQGQTYSLLDIILVVNDSSDSSGAICRDLASKDSRVRVFESPAAGVSKARNIGIESALGSYVTFVDADDFIHEDLIMRLHSELVGHHAQVATTAIEKYDKSLLGTERKGRINEDTVSTYMYARRLLLGVDGYYGYSCCKMYSRELVGDIRFDESLNFSEDTDFLLRLMAKNGKVYVSSFIGYFYSQDTGGVTKQKSGDARTKSLPLSDMFIENATDDKTRAAAKCYYWRNAYYILSQSSLSSEAQDMVWSAIKKYRHNVIFSGASPVKYRLIAALMLPGRKFFMNIVSRLAKEK